MEAVMPGKPRTELPMEKRGCVLLLGATSALGRALAEGWASEGMDLFLASRDEFELDRIATDLRLRFGVAITTRSLDMNEPARFSPLLQELATMPTKWAGVACVVGYLGEPPNATDPEEVERIIRVNFLGPLQFLGQVADCFAARKEGFIVGIASVAGDRGRPSNFVYGAAKAGYAVALEGIRHRLAPFGVRVLTVKPGFLDTAMTYGRPGIPFAAPPKQAARVILRALKRGKSEIYVPWFWRGIMAVIRCLPDRLMVRI